MEWIVKALKPEGKAFVIIPGGMLDRIPDKKLRKFIAEECFIDAIISLPNKTFFTTTKKTYILAITKKAKRTLMQKEPVFTYLVSDIGESLDKDRFDIPSNHLDDAAGLFNQFKNDRHKFKSLDKRCKIQPCKHFVDTHDNWDIDRMWSTEEKIELGIEEKKNVITPRTSIDSYVYNLYFSRRPKYGISREFTQEYKEYVLKSLWNRVWDLFVYCPIMWKLEDESELRVGQKDNPDYQREIDDYTYFFLIYHNVPFITLTEREDEQRIIQIENAIKDGRRY